MDGLQINTDISIDYDFAKRIVRYFLPVGGYHALSVSKYELSFFDLDCANWETGDLSYIFQLHNQEQVKKFEQLLPNFLNEKEMKVINRYKKLKRIIK